MLVFVSTIQFHPNSIFTGKARSLPEWILLLDDTATITDVNSFIVQALGANDTNVFTTYFTPKA
jgi:hypothetical protein